MRAVGHEVIAVEPDEQMRAVAADRHPGTQVLAGSAEDIPLPDESVDAVVVGQARLDREIGELAATDPTLAGRDSVKMPYRTCVYRMRRV